jgi:histidinol phosphatase-like enzyme
VVVLSNQSGVGRGMFTLARVHEAMAMLRHLLRRHGVELDAIILLPASPVRTAAAAGSRAPSCSSGPPTICSSDLKSSAVIGDKMIDVRTDRTRAPHGILVRTGYGREEEGRSGTPPSSSRRTLGEAVDWLLAREGLGTQEYAARRRRAQRGR